MVKTISDIVGAIQSDSVLGLSLQLGDISFGGNASPQFDARSSVLDPAVLGQATPTSDLRAQFGGPNGAPNLSAQSDTSPGALRLPILDDPRNAIGWILGIGEANLLTWDLPDVKVSFPVGFTVPTRLPTADCHNLAASSNRSLLRKRECMSPG